jgi:inorganic pyrophosphatase
MITFREGNEVFNYRVVGVILHEGRVLLQSAEDIDFWVLPGGRGELGESAQEAVVREMFEELGEVAEVRRLLWVLENFFDYQEKSWHEISFFFLLSLPPGSPVYSRVEFEGYEPVIEAKLVFRWFSLDALNSITLYPVFLRKALHDLPETTQYVVFRENAEPEMRPDLTAYLGKRVVVMVDRPLGSRHPRDPGMVYPVNYGYLPGTVSGDGHPIDAYLIGVGEPVEWAEGIVVALVLRADDVEDKLVVATEGRSYSVEQIAEQVRFQEQYFDSRIVTTRTNREDARSAERAKERRMESDHRQEDKEDHPTVLLLCTDLMFGVQLQNMVKHAGLRPMNVRPGTPLPPAALMVADHAARTDVPAAIREAVEQGIPVVAFGPHMDAEGRRAAKEAGATRVLANSNLTRDLPGVLALVK